MDAETNPAAADHGSLLTVAEACVQLRVSRWTVNRLIRERRLKTIKIGARRLIPRTAVLEFVTQSAAEEAV